MQVFKASTKPGRQHLLTLLLIMLMHLALWQVIRHPGLSGRAHTTDDVVAYLDVLNIVQPRPKPAVAADPPARAVIPERPQVARNNRPTPITRTPTPAVPSANPITIPAPASDIDASNTANNGNNSNVLSLDLDALRSSALALDRQRKPGEIEQMQASQRRSDTLEKRLGEGTKRAEKKECLKAFSGLGVLAVIPLAISTVVDTGCKW